jgi:putative SOS response-associated peptidase YedK
MISCAMCNHFRNHPADLQTWREYIGWDQSSPDFASDVWPKYRALTVRDAQGTKVLDSMTWGVPFEAPGKRPGTKVKRQVTNVRNLESPFWRAMLIKAELRCLVPFTAFAEPKPNAGREEVWFAVPNAPSAAFAGIWRPSPMGNVFAFLTCEPNPLVAPIHPKAMPVILHPEDYDRWLGGEPVTDLAVPFPSQLMAIVA